MIKNKYKNDYKEGSSGKFTYVGKHYVLPMTEEEKKKTDWLHTGVVTAFFALEILAGLINQDSSRTGWIVFPYLFLFLPTGYMAIGAFSYTGVHVIMERSEYQNSLVRLHRSCLAVMILAGLNLLLDLVFILMHASTIDLLKESQYFLCFLAVELTGIFYGRRYDQLYANIRIES